jgi:hypothetical protein
MTNHTGRAPAVLLALLALTLPTRALSAQTVVSQTESVGGLAPRSVFIAAERASPNQAKLEALALFLGLELEANTRLVQAVEEDKADIVISLSATAVRNAFDLIGVATLREAQADAAQSASPAAPAPRPQAPLRYAARVSELGIEQARAFFTEFGKRLDAAYPPVPAKITEIVTERVVQETETLIIVQGAWLTVLAPAGTLLKLPAGEEAIVDDTGEWRRELEQNSSFGYRAELAGHRPQDRLVFIGADGVIEALEFEELDRWRFGLDIRYGNFVFVPQAEWFFLPGTFFIGGGIESSYLALVQSYDHDDEGLLVHYLDAQVSAGAYLGRADAALRSGFTLGLAARLDAGKGLFRFADYAPVSARAGLRVSWDLGRGFSALAEANVRLALVLAPEGVDPARILDPMPVGLPIAEGLFYFEMPTIFIGGRYGL